MRALFRNVLKRVGRESVSQGSSGTRTAAGTCERDAGASIRQSSAPTLDACNILFGTLYGRPTYTELRLLNIAIAAESLHAALFPKMRAMPTERFDHLRTAALADLDGQDAEWVRPRLRNEPSYGDRLLHLLDQADQAAVDTLIPDRATWVKQMKDTRNGMAHRARPKVSTDALFELAEVSRYVLYLVLMQQLGLSGEVQRRAVKQNQFLSHRRHEQA